jgi:hypothetical protein
VQLTLACLGLLRGLGVDLGDGRLVFPAAAVDGECYRAGGTWRQVLPDAWVRR